jgi:hypothetical protein
MSVNVEEQSIMAKKDPQVAETTSDRLAASSDASLDSEYANLDRRMRAREKAAKKRWWRRKKTVAAVEEKPISPYQSRAFQDYVSRKQMGYIYAEQESRRERKAKEKEQS